LASGRVPSGQDIVYSASARITYYEPLRLDHRLRLQARGQTRGSVVTLIAISGIDGSGKTTLANELVTMLAAAGFSARYCYGRFVPKRLRTIIHLFRKLRFGTTQEHGYPSNYAGERRNLVRNPLISWALKGTIGTAYVIGTSRKLRRLLSQHEFIVCDRYLLDTWILDACLGTGGLSRSDIRLLQVLTDFLPRPDF